ncbi:MAG: stage II sporulation protein M [Candidatus Woesearchaeota archaeon]
MVFEQLFTARWIKKKPLYSFLLGIGYSLLGVMTAIIIFPRQLIGVGAIAFTALILLPSLNQLLSIEENIERQEKKFNLKIIFRDHIDLFEIFIFMFFGIFLVYSSLTLIFPEISVNYLFSAQSLMFDKKACLPFINAGCNGGFDFSYFIDILSTNILVMFVCILLSVLYGAGSVLFLTWTASLWGNLLAIMARESALIIGQNHIFYFLGLFARVFPHLFLEAASFFLAIVGGGVISKAILREKNNNERFKRVIADSMIFFLLAILLLIIGAIIEVFIYR